MPVLQAVCVWGSGVGLRAPSRRSFQSHTHTHTHTNSLSHSVFVCVYNSHNSRSPQSRHPLPLPTNMNTTQPATDSHQSVTHTCAQCTLCNTHTHTHTHTHTNTEGRRISQKHLMQGGSTVRQQDTGDFIGQMPAGK